MDEIYWPSVFFLLFSGVACVFAVAVLVSKNIVRMAFYLVMSLGIDRRAILPGGCRFCRCHATHDLRGWYARAPRFWCDAHFARTFCRQ